MALLRKVPGQSRGGKGFEQSSLISAGIESLFFGFSPLKNKPRLRSKVYIVVMAGHICGPSAAFGE